MKFTFAKTQIAAPRDHMRSGGFTLVEVMIAVGLFAVIMVVGIGAVLNTNVLHKKNQNQRVIMDNLSFLIEDMSRNLRLGANYSCPADIAPAVPANFDYSFSAPLSSGAAVDCSPGNEGLSIAFDPMGADPSPTELGDQMIYVIDSVNEAIYKSMDGGDNFLRITPAEIVIDTDRSGFTVIGTGQNATQPRVIIRLSGKILYKNGVESPFDIQTTVSQRLMED